MSRFLRNDYRLLKPYTPGEQPKNGENIIKLNTNENPYEPAPGVIKILNDSEVSKLRLYSDPEAKELIKAVSDFYGVKENMVMTGNGSDEVLAFTFMAFQNERKKIYYPQISYSFYPVYCNIFGVNGVEVPLRDDFSIAPEDYYEADGTIVITNPNAPTGIALSLEEIEEILKNNTDNLVVIDEAYVDFGADSAVKLLERYDNLLVIQTLSKSRSLAGARVGFAIGSPEIIEDLNKIKFSFNPYNLNRLSILAGAEAVRDREYFDKTRKKIMDTRERFNADMEKLGFNVIPSKANFVFVSSETISGEEYFTKLRKYNIIVRHFKDEKTRDYVRITIGTPDEMNALVKATREILEEYSQEE